MAPIYGGGSRQARHHLKICRFYKFYFVLLYNPVLFSDASKVILVHGSLCLHLLIPMGEILTEDQDISIVLCKNKNEEMFTNVIHNVELVFDLTVEKHFD